MGHLDRWLCGSLNPVVTGNWQQKSMQRTYPAAGFSAKCVRKRSALYQLDMTHAVAKETKAEAATPASGRQVTLVADRYHTNNPSGSIELVCSVCQTAALDGSGPESGSV